MYNQDSKDLIHLGAVKTPVSPTASAATACYSERFSPGLKNEPVRRCATSMHQGRDYSAGFLYGQHELFDNLLTSSDSMKTLRHDGFLHPHLVQNPSSSSAPNGRHPNQMSHATLESLDMMEALSANSVTPLTSMADHHHHHHHHHHHPAFSSHASLSSPPGSHAAIIHAPMYSSHPAVNGSHAHLVHSIPHGHGHGHHHPLHPGLTISLHDMEADPRELEAFAERFKQRRIKLGVTQADVGRALANLRLPGVGALSQSTICRFESLTLSHNNMIALKPILHAWLEEAEAQARDKARDPEAPSVLPSMEKKRKRTSIATPEKRSLEAYFAVQPRPSSEKIAAIAEKLDLKKNVVRVWFCNQRQKQKRLKFAAQHSC